MLNIRFYFSFETKRDKQKPSVFFFGPKKKQPLGFVNVDTQVILCDIFIPNVGGHLAFERVT